MMVHIPRRSQIFIVRTWTEARGEEMMEMRGMVRNVHSGETRYFRTWKALLKFVAANGKEPGYVYSPPPISKPERRDPPTEEGLDDASDANPD